MILIIIDQLFEVETIYKFMIIGKDEQLKPIIYSCAGLAHSPLLCLQSS